MKDDPSETGYDMEKTPLIRKQEFSERASGFRRDEEKNDKKRRAELILRQATENQQELTHFIDHPHGQELQLVENITATSGYPTGRSKNINKYSECSRIMRFQIQTPMKQQMGALKYVTQ
uniref:Uncharacterized protein n=1 Tax=Solanum lycopersicum TaxID=4081 RepID=A0A3Q7ILX8_SOLLC